jgi:hypothetical protein
MQSPIGQKQNGGVAIAHPSVENAAPIVSGRDVIFVDEDGEF